MPKPVQASAPDWDDFPVDDVPPDDGPVRNIAEERAGFDPVPAEAELLEGPVHDPASEALTDVVNAARAEPGRVSSSTQGPALPQEPEPPRQTTLPGLEPDEPAAPPDPATARETRPRRPRASPRPRRAASSQMELWPDDDSSGG